jgi:DNA repair protein RadD
MGHDLYRPEIKDKKTTSDSVPVDIECPMCHFINQFWGIKDSDGEVIEHFGRKCMGGVVSEKTMMITPCSFKFRFKLCPSCSYENDISARTCTKCQSILIDADSKLKQAKLSKNSHILTPDRIEYNTKVDKFNNPYLEVRYYDFDGQYLSEAYFFNSESGRMKFNINFMRFHSKRPERLFNFNSAEELVKNKNLLRSPKFVIARKQDKFWKITEKVFIEEL